MNRDKDPLMGVSLRAYARMRGCTEGAVRKAIATKRITPNADGTLDPERANQEWERNTFAGKTLHQATRAQVAPLVAAAKSEAEIHRILASETNALRRKTAKAISDAGY